MRLWINKISLLALALGIYFLYAHLSGRPNIVSDHIATERARAKAKINIIELNFLIPSFKELAAFGRREIPPAAVNWAAYVAYFEKIVELMPERFDAHVFLGPCYFYQGRKDLALRAFQEAVRLNPGFFWSTYNLGVLGAQGGNCPLAAEAFALALKVPLSETLQNMRASKLYVDLSRDAGDFGSLVEQDLKAAYANAVPLMALAEQCRGDSKWQNPLVTLASGIQIQVF